MSEEKYEVLIAVANQIRADDIIFSLEALQDIVNKHPDVYRLEGNNLYMLVTIQNNDK